MRFPHYFDDISFSPFKKELGDYSLKSLHKDLTAGISVALLTLPQAMAYALVAGLPLSTGLFAAIFSCLIAALFGSSRHLVIGPSNAIAILIQYGTSEIMYQYYRHLTGGERDMVAFQIMTQLTLLVAGMHLLAAGFKLGHLTQFVSYSVVIGYVMGASAAIIINQLFVFFGIPRLEGVSTLYSRVWHFVTHLSHFHAFTLGIGVLSLSILLFLKRQYPKFPGALITFALVTLLLVGCRWYFGGEFHHVSLIGDVGEVTGLVPRITMPHFDYRIMNNLLPIAFAVALLSILETSSVAKSIASHTGQRLSINQEILGLGLGNLTSALCGAMPISGSSSRSILNYESGAETRLAAISGALLVGLILYVFGDLVMQIPLAALSALLLMTATNLVKKKNLLLCLKATSADAFVFWVTFLSCIFFSIDVAFYIGVCISITLYLKKAAIPQVLQYAVDESGRLSNLDRSSQEKKAKICFIKVKGELFFGAADIFQTTLKTIAEDETDIEVIILHLKNARDMDATTCLAIRQLFDYVKSTGRHLLISGIPLSLWEVLSDSGIVNLIGKGNLFVIDERYPNRYFQRVLDRANFIISRNQKNVVEEVSEEQDAPSLVAVQDPA